jgi:GDP-D-glucose phosphorylase
LVKPRQLGSSQDNSIIINVSPLEFGNSLLVPDLKNNIPQMVTLDGFELLVKVVLLSRDR